MDRRDSYKERVGVLNAALIFTEEINWVFRELGVVDVGIDGIVEKSDNGTPSAKFMAVQIKSGSGNFHEQSNHYTYYISKWHYQYWTQSNIPVILVAYFLDTQTTIWEHLDKEKIQRTKKKWKISIPKNKKLSSSSIPELTQILDNSTVQDYFLDIDPNDYTDDKDYDLPGGIEELSVATLSTKKVLEFIHKLEVESGIMSKDLLRFAKAGIQRYDPRVKGRVKKFSGFMSNLADEIDHQMDVFSTNATEGLRNYEKLLAVDFVCNKNSDSTIDSLKIVFDLSMNFIDAIRSIKWFIPILDGLPDDFISLKKAKANFTDSMDSLLEEFEIASGYCDSFVLRIKQLMIDTEYNA